MKPETSEVMNKKEGFEIMNKKERFAIMNKKGRTHMKRLSLSLALLCAGLSLSAQLTAVSYEEALRGFERQYVEGETMEEHYEHYNRLIFCDTDHEDTLRVGRWLYVSESAVLNAAGGITLPPSLFMMKDYANKKGYSTYQLYYVASKDDADKKIYQRLKKKYGEVALNDSVSVIPARWVNKAVTYASLYCQIYANQYVTPYVDTLLPDGDIWREKSVRRSTGTGPYRKTLKSAVYNISNGVNSIFDDTFTVTLDGWTNGLKESKQQLALLSREVNTLLPRRPDFADTLRYNVVFEVDTTKKIHLRIPHPEALTSDDNRRLEELASTLERLEDSGMECLLTIDGRIMPYQYINAVYSRRGWEFADYLWLGRRYGPQPGPCYSRWTKRNKYNVVYPSGLFGLRNDVVTAINEVLNDW